MTQFQVSTDSFQTICDVWKSHLWPDRKSDIEPISWIDHNGEINMTMKIGAPTFWTMTDEKNKVIGVISGFRTSDIYYRSRGLWVDEQFRGHGLARILIQKVYEQALIEDCQSVWTMARHTAVNFYDKVGFKTYKSTDAYEFGPHYLMQSSVMK